MNMAGSEGKQVMIHDRDGGVIIMTEDNHLYCTNCKERVPSKEVRYL